MNGGGGGGEEERLWHFLFFLHFRPSVMGLGGEGKGGYCAFMCV